MRKSFVLGLGAFVFAGAASAASITAGTAVTTASDGGDCVFLSTDVNVNLSKSVSMGYDCRIADATLTPPTVNRVLLGACHIGGTAKARSVACTGSEAGGDLSPTGCTDADVAAGASKQVSGVAMFRTSTAGGSIGEDGMATTACDAAGISTLVTAIEE